jgi:ABC-type multidrug transport system fused ATPase/permease subunit
MKAAFVGHNGAGKSTIIKLLLRLYDPTGGQILVNGMDIRSYDLQKYAGFLPVHSRTMSLCPEAYTTMY